jgi:hypothetical protein
LAISGVEITPASTESDTATRSFQDCPVLAGGTPSAGTTAWCVAIEPIEGGKIGRVAVAGVVQCKVNVVNENDCYAVCSTTTAALKSAQSGEGQILWKQAGTGDGKWALVRIGHDRQLARGTFTGDWQASSPKTITDSVDSSVTYQVKNTLGDLRMAGGNTNCLITLISGEWYLVSFDLNKLYGKSSSQTQLLGHVQGTLALQWIDTTSCQ